MKIITIQKSTPENGGYVASVNGMRVVAFGKDEVTALEILVNVIKEKNKHWIQRSDWEQATPPDQLNK